MILLEYVYSIVDPLVIGETLTVFADMRKALTFLRQHFDSSEEPSQTKEEYSLPIKEDFRAS